MLRPVLAFALLGAGWAPRMARADDVDGRPVAGARGEPRSFTPHADELAPMLRGVSPACRAAAERAWQGGRGGWSCAKEVARVGRKQLRSAPQRFGVVLHRRVDLTTARVVLALASRCREWPTPRRGNVLAEHDALSSGCRLRPYRGEVTMVLVAADGRRVDGPHLHADREGVVRFRFADIDAQLRERGLGTLDDYVRLEAGHDGWAGRFDLQRLRGFLADWHLAWVRRGRGSPALFALRHPEHPRAQVAFDLAVESNLARQQHDFVEVERGILAPASFLDRYVWSPMRHSVESMLAEARADASQPGGSMRSGSAPAGSSASGSPCTSPECSREGGIVGGMPR